MIILDFLADNPLFTFVLILALGLALGKIRFFGLSFGAAMVLFVALGLATFNPDIQVPALLYQFGLAMFVYAIGLAAGPTFFREFKTRGWKITLFGIVLLAMLVLVGWGLIRLFNLDPVTGAGMWAGAMSSTPGMAAIVDAVDPSQAQAPVVGYSLAYPGGVIGIILVAAIGASVLKVNHAQAAKDAGIVTEPLVWRGIEIGPGVQGRIGELPEITGEQIIATRIVDDRHHHLLADPNAMLEPGQQLVVNGTPQAIERAIEVVGKPCDVKIEDTELEFTHYTVSSRQVAGRTVGDLDTLANGFLIARVRSGDSVLVPSPSTVLNYSDRVRVVAAPGRMKEVRAFFGDSERALGDVDLFSFAIGLACGLAIGLIPIPLPGGTTLSFGFGGGPIVAGLILGAFGRTGPLNWQLPFHANRTMQTLGLAVFLAGVGTSAGAGFRAALSDSSSLMYIFVGFLVTLISALTVAIAAPRVLKMSWDESMGLAAGMTTNPAVISYLNGQTGTELPSRGYTTVYPTAMVGKIVAAQVLVMLVV